MTNLPCPSRDWDRHCDETADLPEGEIYQDAEGNWHWKYIHPDTTVTHSDWCYGTEEECRKDAWKEGYAV